ncbi:MAG: site-2 protease family protein [Solirubrobacteraceae bacterium]|nr:site-2 protease family protein [Solirubrobacteraceae bacterium]
MSYLLAFLGFSVLIILHELGHFFAAKAVGMRAERFSLFFPPHVLKFRRGETEYCIGTVPLGGYVKISGMSPSEDLPPEVASRAYLRQPVWKRIVVIAAGPLVNLVLAFAIIAGLYLALGTSTGTTRVDTIERAAPAAGALVPGDRIVAVDGVRGDAAALGKQIASHRCAGEQTDGCRTASPAAVTVVRDGQQRTLSIVPRYDAQARRARLGFSFAVESRSVGPVDAAGQSIDAMWRVTTATLGVVGKLVYDQQARDEISGIVGSYEVTRQSFEFNTAQALWVLAVISLSLALINLFPFLPLDGGHIFWALAEKLRGRPIPIRVMERASVVGFVLIAMLFVIGLTNDIDRLRGGGFPVR